MNVLITGASGFIGNSILRYFREKGADVTGWDVHGSEDGSVQSVDMCVQANVEQALGSPKPDVIVHCAGSANVSDSIANPDRDMMLNVNVTHNLLFAMLHHELKSTRLIYLSSAGVYGNPVKLPIREDDPRTPVSPYALHKTMCEDMCRYFNDNHGFDVRVARIFSAYGAGLRKQIFWDMHRKYVVSGRLEMYGTGDESRDFINIEDLKRAIYLLAVSDYEQKTVNVANGVEVRICDAVRIFAARSGIPESAISFNGNTRAGDPINWCADVSVLKSLGYEQQVTLEEGIGAYVEWLGCSGSAQ
ncbi:MAG: SDR family oxidoreductase [Lachnospiraceae bacterium]|nr:SDR family oxidoreductase [Lachnospiraceae bacterium]MBQ8947849.1 SDR family oxidoreductase [Lachnospiraceae bacterium]